MNRRNFVKKFGRELVGGLVGITLINSCDNPKIEIYKGKIIKENFVPATSGWGGQPDKYEMLIILENGNKKIFSYLGLNAREMNLQYDVGDSVKIEKKIYPLNKKKIDERIQNN